MTIMYGIKNCDTVKKAQKWLTANNVEYSFHDFKTDGLTKSLLEAFVAQSDWSLLLNKRSTTFRNLPDDVKDNLTPDVIFKAILAQPTLLKRPVIIHKNTLNVGFKAPLYEELFL